MGAGPLALELIIVFCVALLLLHHYGRIFKQHPLVTIATLVAWYFSLIIVFILPLDVSSTFYRQCTSSIAPNVEQEAASTENTSAWLTNATEQTFTDTTAISSTVAYIYNNQSRSFGTSNETLLINATDNTTTEPLLITGGNIVECKKPWSYVTVDTLPVMWHIVYWTSQLLTWLILPFMQSYVRAGDFSPLGKIKRAILENAFYYGSYLLIFGILLIYIAASPKLNLQIVQLKVILITASNTWGLFLLVLLLGYGLVEVPRKIWNAANLSRSSALTYFQLARLSTEKQEAIEDLEDVLEEVKKVSAIVRYNHPMRKFVNIIISKCPESFQERVGQGIDDFEDYSSGRGRSDVPTEKVLVRIHRQLIQAVHTKIRTNVQWSILIERAIHLENVSKNNGLLERSWKDELPSNNHENFLFKFLCNNSLRWYWYCLFQPYLRKFVAICLAIFSVMVVWSECTFFNEKPVLSLFAIFVNLAKRNYDYFYIELACCLTISYLCVCAYYTVFRIKFFNYYYIAGHHQTDEVSLMFVGMMLCRLTAPLCLNFLGMIHLDTHITGDTGVETSYTEIMGHLDVISLISDGFNIYFPILVCVLCVATYFSLGQRCLSAIGFQRFIDGADDMTTDLIDEGRQLVNREKRRLQRELNSLKRSEVLGNNNLANREWKGKNMRNAEAESQEPSRSMRYKRKQDKLELLDDVEPIDYKSVTNQSNPSEVNRDIDDDGNWGNTSSDWGATSYQKPKSTRSLSRPPKNLFDDV